jgi:hypothetical protein
MNTHRFADAVRAAVSADCERTESWPIFYWQGPDETDDRWSTLRRPTYTQARRVALDPSSHAHRRDVACVRQGVARTIRREILIEEATLRR